MVWSHANGLLFNIHFIFYFLLSAFPGCKSIIIIVINRFVLVMEQGMLTIFLILLLFWAVVLKTIWSSVAHVFYWCKYFSKMNLPHTLCVRYPCILFIVLLLQEWLFYRITFFFKSVRLFLTGVRKCESLWWLIVGWPSGCVACQKP